MQLSSEVHIPDGLLAANALLAENSRLGLPTSMQAPHPGIGFRISSTAMDFQFRCSGIVSDPVVAPNKPPLSPQAQACENKIQGAVNSALNTNSNYLGPTTGPGLSPMGYRNGAYNFNFFAPGVTNPVAGSNGGSGRFPGSGLHIPLPGGQDPTIMPWGYNAQAGGSYFTAHYDSANPTDDLVSFFEHIINDVILRRPHGC
jgi:hypothetical protein